MTEVFYLFGGDTPWSEVSWLASDDRVRGGKSRSYLDCSSGSKAVFSGDLDITALGGAGFASQRTVEPRAWNVSGYAGLSIKLGQGDEKKYTLTLKDEILPKRPDGRDQSTVSWEYDFADAHSTLLVSWDDFRPTYRGKPKPDPAALDLRSIKRISIMMRSFFGEQEGPFRMEIEHIAATTTLGVKDQLTASVDHCVTLSDRACQAVSTQCSAKRNQSLAVSPARPTNGTQACARPRSDINDHSGPQGPAADYKD